MPSEHNYRGRDLRGASFRNRDLTGADFRGADVRGANFSDARLVGASFTGARIGVRPFAGAAILALALAASVAAGIMVGYFADTVRNQAAASDWRDVVGGWLLVLVVLVFLGSFIVKGIRQAVWVTLIVLGAVLVIDAALVYSAAGELRFLNAGGLIGLLLLFGLAALAGVLGRIVGGVFGVWAIGVVALVGGLAAGRANGGLAAIVVSLVLAFISKRALKLDERDRPLHKLANWIVTRRGTRFTRADLSGADFTDTLLNRAEVSHAILDGVIWESETAPPIGDGDVS